MTTQTSHLPFDLSVAMNHLSAKDEKLAELITSTLPFQMDADPLQSPYEALLESIAYQSISGKAAATIFGRVKALSATGRAPTPQEMLKLRKPVLRKAGLSGAKILAMKDLAQKTIDGIVPSLEQAEKLSDEELVERLVSVRGIGAWSVEMFFDLPSRPPRRPPHTRPRRKKRLVRNLRQKTHAQAQATPRLRRTLAPLPHRRQLVHVARLRARRLRHHQQNPPAPVRKSRHHPKRKRAKPKRPARRQL